MMGDKYFLGVHVLLDELDKRIVTSVIPEFFLVHLLILETNICVYVCMYIYIHIIFEIEIIYL